MAEDYTDIMAAAATAAGLEPAAIVAPTDHWVELNGIRFHYLDWGNDHLPHVRAAARGIADGAHVGHGRPAAARPLPPGRARPARPRGDTGWTPEDQLGEDNSDLMLEDTRQFIEHRRLRPPDTRRHVDGRE